jgi:hypothetical protein
VIGDLVIVLAIAIVGAVGGIVLGILVAPRIGHLAERGGDATRTEEMVDDREP